MMQQHLNLPETFPSMSKMLAAMVKFGEEKVSSVNLEIRMQEGIDADLIRLLEDNSYIQVCHSNNEDLYSLTEKGKAFAQTYLNQ